MNVSELFDLTHWVTNEIEGARVTQKYQELQKIIQQHSQPNQQKQPFESQKDNLIETLRDVPLGRLTRDQLAFLDQLGISSAVGEEGITIVEDILYKNVIDVATSAQKLQQILQRVNDGLAKSKQIKAGEMFGMRLVVEYRWLMVCPQRT